MLDNPNEYKNKVKYLEQRKRNILVDKEATWRLERRSLWLSKRNENTKFSIRFSIIGEM
jgi:hypothetical protein